MFVVVVVVVVVNFDVSFEQSSANTSHDTLISINERVLICSLWIGIVFFQVCPAVGALTQKMLDKYITLLVLFIVSWSQLCLVFMNKL